MTPRQLSDSDDNDDYAFSSHSMNHAVENEGDDEFDSASTTSDEDELAPTHPIPALQEAFEESIIEAAQDVQYETAPRLATHPSAESRRQDLLEQPTWDDSWITRWKQNPSAKCHPLTKLIAQIIFGMHLLHHHQAKSDAEVVKILQAHVDDIDGFLEKTTDDFDLAIKDIEERLSFLQLPMTHVDVFAIMLEDRTFRTQLVDGNDKIEDIINRTAKAMNAALSDVQKGIIATQELANYLDQVHHDWPQDYSELPAIFSAMRGNQEGWLGCFQDLQMSGNRLGVVLVKLGTTIGEMSKLAAAASRRSMAPKLSNQNEHYSAPRSKYASGGSKSQQSRKPRHLSHHSLDKPLPSEPNAIQPAVQATLPLPWHQHQSSVGHRVNEPSRRTMTPVNQLSDSSRRTSSNLEPRQAQGPRDGRTKAFATFIRHSGPLHSNPPANNEIENPASPVIVVNDSAYSSGSDPAAERRMKKRMTAPQRFGLFPDSKPATPESFSRPTSSRTFSTRVATPTIATPPVRPTPVAAKSSHFSLRRIFHRKSRIQEIV